MSTWAFVYIPTALIGFFAGYGFAAWLEQVNPLCLCRKNAWHPDCPTHGRER